MNKPGASSTLGTDFVVKSKKDGYTILYANTSAVVYARATSPEIVPYDPVKDLEPLGLHCFFPLAVAVQANSRWKTFNELIDYAKKNPGSVRAGLHGQGSIDHFNLELIKSWTETQFNTIPFKGTAATLTALLGGHVDTTVIANSLAGPHVKSGADGYLLKHLNAREFLEMVNGLERGEAAITRQMTMRLLKHMTSVETAGEHLLLSEREIEILRLVASGKSSQSIADQLSISEHTVKYHLKNILRKLGVSNRAQVIVRAKELGL